MALESQGWASELDDFDPTISSKTSRRKGGTQRSQSPNQRTSTMEDLQAEMKLLNWHKLANEAALKAALIRTKNLRKSKGQGLPKMPLDEKAGWMQQVIEEEHTKPLQVSKEWVKKYEAREQVEEGRLASEVEQHITMLTKLRETVAVREESRMRKQAWRDVKHKLRNDKDMLLTGKLQPQMMQDARSSTVSTVDESQNDTQARMDKALGQKSKVQGTLATVISSLDKLLELENRISNLENDNLYEYEQGKAQKERQALKFTKRRTDASLREPSRVSYSVKSVRRPAGGAPQRGDRGRRTRAKPGVGTGTFVTQLPDVHEARGGGRRANGNGPPPDSVAARMAAHQRRGREMGKVQQRGRQRNSSGAMNDVSPIDARNGRRGRGRTMQNQLTVRQQQRGASVGRRSQRGAASVERQSMRGGGRSVSTQCRTNGDGSLERGQRGYRAPRGRQTQRQRNPKKPSHMQQFQDLRKQFEKRKENMRKELYGTGTRSSRAPAQRTTARRRVDVSRPAAVKPKKTRTRPAGTKTKVTKTRTTMPPIKSKTAGGMRQRSTKPRVPRGAQTVSLGVGGVGVRKFSEGGTSKLPPVGGTGVRGVRARRDAKKEPRRNGWM